MTTRLLPRLAIAAACLLLATAAAAQGQSSSRSKDLSVECPPTAAGGKHHAATRTPLSTRSEAQTLHKDMAQCTSKRDRSSRAECAREVWEEHAAATGTEPSNQRMAMADCR
jgi:hypothetical protein